MSRPFLFLPEVFLGTIGLSLVRAVGFRNLEWDLIPQGESPKEQLESVVLQMFRSGLRCSEAVREFQKAFILTVSKIKEAISAKLRRNSVFTGTRFVVRSEF